MLVLLMILLKVSLALIDVNLPEYYYLTNHLTVEECRRLVAALHFKAKVNEHAIDEAERKVPEDIPCIGLLLHWNSAKGEGLGETHELLRQGLNAIGRADLAVWLGKAVFRELGEELTRDLDQPFKDILQVTTDIVEIPVPTLPDKYSNASEWNAFDTICITIIVILIIVAIVLLVDRMRKRRKLIQEKKKGYTKIEHDQNLSSSESEDKFDIRKNTV